MGKYHLIRGYDTVLRVSALLTTFAEMMMAAENEKGHGEYGSNGDEVGDNGDSNNNGKTFVSD